MNSELTFPDLETLQQTFADALLDPAVEEGALALFKGDLDINQRRFSIYRNNCMSNWQNACANAYPVFKQLVGEAFFNHVVNEYRKCTPSQSGNLTGLGRLLPEYIASLESCHDYTYFVDVAALEWLVHSAYYLEQRTPASITELATFPPEKLSELRFKLQETCFLFHSPWVVVPIWEAHQHPNPILPERLKEKTYCVVWRMPGLRVQVSSISAASYAALAALKASQTLGEALECALAQDPEFAIQTELIDWFNKHLFSEVCLTS